MKGRPWRVAALMAVLVPGCSGSAGSGPPRLRFGEEACAHCRMIISDERFASALVMQDGEVLKFDDVGCMVLHERDASLPVAARWVRDYGSSGWLDCRGATFVHSRETASPMGHDLAAVAGPEHAPALGKGSAARPMRYDELARFVGEQRVAEPDQGDGRASPRDFESSSKQESLQ